MAKKLLETEKYEYQKGVNVEERYDFGDTFGGDNRLIRSYHIFLGEDVRQVGKLRLSLSRMNDFDNRYELILYDDDKKYALTYRVESVDLLGNSLIEWWDELIEVFMFYILKSDVLTKKTNFVRLLTIIEDIVNKNESIGKDFDNLYVRGYIQ